ncbi:MAG: xanthine dehydrogenase family protein molybdopterin-binding subunit [Thermaceae bacterium]|nr:xanthine dehydrogenase family protein molybdopterin-binding subunit [Thermaceae bacterium]
MITKASMSRRVFLKGSAALVVGIGLSGSLGKAQGGEALSRSLNPGDLEAWLAVLPDNTVTVYSGKVELGTGVDTALRQIVAEELYLPFSAITLVQGDTALTPNQGYTAGSQTIQVGGSQLRKAAATARQALLQLAAKKLGVSLDQLVTKGGYISPQNSASPRVSYGALLGGQQFHYAVDPNVKLKDPSQYTLVGTSVPRVDIPAKASGKFTYVQDVRVPGMLHGRVIRPPTTGATTINATLEGVDESSVAQIPGGVKVVRKGNFLGVVAETEWAAIQAAQQLKVRWSVEKTLPQMGTLYNYLQGLKTSDQTELHTGDVEAALAASPQSLHATYQWPYQIHDSIGPSCAVADVRGDQVVCWSPTQGVYPLRGALAQLLGVPERNVRVIYVEGSGCYGHNGADDVTADAALLSQAVGRPVRVQWMRWDEHGWAPKGPAMVMKLRGAIDARGNVAAWDNAVWTPTHSTRPSGEARNLLAGNLIAQQVPTGGPVGGDRNAPVYYRFANNRLVLHWIPIASSPLRPSALRSLGGVQNTFANESFMDELAALAKADPLQFRLNHLDDPRAVAVLQASAERFGWKSGPRKASSVSDIAIGQGIAFARYEGRNAYVAAAAEVEVELKSGAIRVRRIVVAHDCGLVINPDGLRNQIEGNVVQALGRTLKEEVRFDSQGVQSTDWSSYPIITFPEVPTVEVVLIDRPHEPAVGAGEATTVVIPGAIGNAVFDATGVRLRTVPFTPQQFLAQASP